MSRFLERWSRLKRQGEIAPASAPGVAPAAVEAAPAAVADAEPAPGRTATLPPVESLDLGADFTAFMKKEVSDSLRRAALRKLFADPHFHFERMDKLDIYIDDYSTAQPIPQELLQRLRQFETLLGDQDGEAGPRPEAGGEMSAPAPAVRDASPAHSAGPSRAAPEGGVAEDMPVPPKPL